MVNSKFLLDENIPKSVRNLLKSKGFEAEYTQKGISDEELASLAKKQKSIIVSRDSDFLNSSLFPPEKYFGIIVFLIHPPKAEKLVSAMALLLSETKDFTGKVFGVWEKEFKINKRSEKD